MSDLPDNMMCLPDFRLWASFILASPCRGTKGHGETCLLGIQFVLERSKFAHMQTHLDTWSKEWQLSIPEQRTLYLAAADVLRLSKVCAGMLSPG